MLKNIIRVVGLKEHAWDITCCNVPLFVSKNSTLDKNCFWGAGGGSSFLFYLMFTLNTAIGTGASLNFVRTFSSQTHEGSKRIPAFVTNEGACITWTETIHHMKLHQFFITAASPRWVNQFVEIMSSHRIILITWLFYWIRLNPATAPSTNPFGWPPMRLSGEIHQIYAIGGANSTTIVVMFVG